MLLNVVSKNGNLLLSIPVRGNGAIDEDEVAFLHGLTRWMDVNGEGIFASRPWKIYGEGPAQSSTGMFNENRVTYGAQDIRFTTKKGDLYAYLLGWPGDNATVIKALATNSPQLNGRKIARVSLLGYDGKLDWTQDDQGLSVKMPPAAPTDHAVALKISGLNLA